MNELFNSKVLLSFLNNNKNTVFSQYTYDDFTQKYYFIQVNKSLKLYSVSWVDFSTGYILFSTSNKKDGIQNDAIKHLSLDKSDEELFQEFSVLQHNEYITVLMTQFICEYYEKYDE